MLTLQQMRDMVRKRLGVTIQEIDNVSVDLLLNMSFWDLLNRFPFRENETFVPFQTIAGQRLYALPVSFEAIRTLGISTTDTLQHTDLQPMDNDEYEKVFNENVDMRAIPERYIRDGNCIKLWPTPDKVYTLTLYYWIQLSDLTDINNNPRIPRNWHEIIVIGAVWRGWIDLNDWTRAQTVREFCENMINGIVPAESKEERDFHRATTPVLRERYDPYLGGDNSLFGQVDPRTWPGWEFEP